MDSELKPKWVSALRSGEFKQTAGTLELVTEEGRFHCCLGVLYRVANGVCPEHRTTPRSSDLSDWEISESERITLECMNDGGKDDGGEHWTRRSFAEIADWIEANL